MSDSVNIQQMWKLLNESNAETMQLKLFKNEGDPKPYRAIIFVEGIEAVEKVNKFIEGMSGETYTSPRIKA
jgi:hypothetical protein